MGQLGQLGVALAAVVACLATVAANQDAQEGAGRLKVPGGEIAYDVTGSGPAVVFLHGAFMDRRAWDRQVPAFARRGFRVVRYDIRPFGESTQPQAPYSVPADLLALLDHLRIERAHLVGHSFGGGVALDFALLHPSRVDRLVLAAAPPGGLVPPPEEVKLVAGVFAAVKDGDDAIVKAWLEHPMWKVARSRPDVLKELEVSTRRNLAPFRMKAPPYLPLTPPAIQRLGELKVPTLAVVGDADMPSIIESAKRVAKEAANGDLKVIAGADHALPLGWADEFNAAVLAFLAAAR
jgi:pimeloyl-ACP methyl ester carboxylesterase